MTRENAIHCDERPKRGPSPLCAFTLAIETYGIISGVVGYCTVHDGGKITIGISVKVWADVPSKSQVRDCDRKITRD